MTRGRFPVLAPMLLGALLALAGFAAGRRSGPGPGGGDTGPVGTAPEPRVVAARGDLAADEAATIELFRAASPSVAYITSVAVRRDFFNLNLLEIPQGSGSGFLWDAAGHVVTNFHVVAAGGAARVTLADGSSWEAGLVGAAPEKDLAVLRIEAPPGRLRPLAVGTSADLQVGQKVFAIGNPFGLDRTLTTGVISALGREIESPARITIRDVVQTDAAINPGNSGGPLLDSAGRLIGVNTAISSPTGAYAGIGFAIPVDTVRWVVPELIARGRIERPTLGVELVPARLAAELAVDGALVLNVVRGGGAAGAGIRGTRRDALGRIDLGDVIVELEGRPVRSPDDLVLALERRSPGEEVAVTVVRDGERRRFRVRLGPPAGGR